MISGQVLLTGLQFKSRSEEDTLNLAADVAMALKPGDFVGLSGDLGSGKSVFCRGVIQHLAQDKTLEVSSPSYTLCNVYEVAPTISHYDLYRLSGSEELDELGFDDALEVGCVLVEWPEKGFESPPDGAVRVVISEENNNTRVLSIGGEGDLMDRIKRSLAIRVFLENHNKMKAHRSPLPADASTRRYELINGQSDAPLLLMDSLEMPDGPPVRHGRPYSQIAHLAESVTPFVAIGQLLHSRKLGAPAIPGYDIDQGLVLVEHMGHASIIDETRMPIPERYVVAVEYLAHVHRQKFSSKCQFADGLSYNIPPYDEDAMLIEAELMLDWYAPRFSTEPLSQAKKDGFTSIWKDLVRSLGSQERSLVLRDYHSPNIIWREGKSGVDRIGVIDFQDALIGPAAYDVASLIQDARVDISSELQDHLLSHYLSLRQANDQLFDPDGFKAGFAIMAAQRATKILGIFVRLDERDGKPHYLQHLPRIQGYLRRSLKDPVLAEYRDWIASVMEL